MKMEIRCGDVECEHEDLKNSRTLFVLVDTCLRVTRKLLRHVTIPEQHFMRIGDRDGTFKSRGLWLFAARSGLLPFPCFVAARQAFKQPGRMLERFSVLWDSSQMLFKGCGTKDIGSSFSTWVCVLSFRNPLGPYLEA